MTKKENHYLRSIFKLELNKILDYLLQFYHYFKVFFTDFKSYLDSNNLINHCSHFTRKMREFGNKFEINLGHCVSMNAILHTLRVKMCTSRSYTVVNFINILLSNFAPIFWCQKLQSWKVTIESFAKHFCTKNVCIKCLT